MAIKIISYNIQQGKNIGRISEWIKQKGPDIFCLQEFPETELGRFSPEYREIFAASFHRGSRVYGELIGYKSTLDLQTAFGVDLGTLRTRPFSSARGKRTVLVANFAVGDKNLVIGNVHLDWFALDGYRVMQLNKVVRSIEEAFTDQVQSVILTGDFNHSNVFSGRGLENFASEKGFVLEGKFDTHTLFGLNHQLDYVINRNCRVKNIRVEKIKLSDHEPILFTVIQNA